MALEKKGTAVFTVILLFECCTCRQKEDKSAFVHGTKRRQHG